MSSQDSEQPIQSVVDAPSEDSPPPQLNFESVDRSEPSDATASQDEKSDSLRALSLDPNGNCRINILQTVPNNVNRAHPYSRCFTIESSFADGRKYITSGYALTNRRILTSDIHYGCRSLKAVRTWKDSNGSTSQTWSWVDAYRAWNRTDAAARNGVGLRYMVCNTQYPVAITDGAGDNTWTTITSILSITPKPGLTLLTRRIPYGELVKGVSSEYLYQVTSGSGYGAEWFSTRLGGYLGRGNERYMLGSPVFITKTSTSLPNGPTITSYLLVGLVTDEVVASDPCTVNVGMFTGDYGVKGLMSAF